MIEYPNLIPITVVAAVAIFLAREMLEAVRRVLANRRKRHALRLLLAAECERNQWVIHWMRNHIPELQEALKQGHVIEVRKTAAGYDRLSVLYEEGHSSSPIPHVKDKTIDRYLFEAASIDAQLFKAIEGVATSLPVLSHLREGLIERVAEDKAWLGSWVEYALRELKDIETSIGVLYKACTGKNATPHRVR